MQSDGNSFCGDDVLDEDNILDQIYERKYVHISNFFTTLYKNAYYHIGVAQKPNFMSLL